MTIVAFDGSVEMSISTIRDMFSAANIAQKKHANQEDSIISKRVEVATQDGLPIRTFSGSILQADRSIDEIKNTDLIIISGVWSEMDPFLIAHTPVVEWLKQQHRQGALIACMHTGAIVLAETGLLDGKVATIYFRIAEAFQSRFPQVLLQPEQKITSSGNLFCSSGVASGVEMALYLIEKFWGIGIAQTISKNFLMDIQREESFFHLAFDDQKRHDDSLILAAQQWLETNFAADFLLEEVADKVGLGLRSFMRRFKKATNDTPLQYVQRVRIEIAKELLLNSSSTVDAISYRVGYENVSFFCQIFKRRTSLTPSEFKQKYQSISAI